MRYNRRRNYKNRRRNQSRRRINEDYVDRRGGLQDVIRQLDLLLDTARRKEDYVEIIDEMRNWTRLKWIIDELIDQLPDNTLHHIAHKYTKIDSRSGPTKRKARAVYDRMDQEGKFPNQLSEFVFSLAYSRMFSPIVSDDHLYEELIDNLNKYGAKKVAQNIVDSNRSPV